MVQIWVSEEPIERARRYAIRPTSNCDAVDSSGLKPQGVAHIGLDDCYMFRIKLCVARIGTGVHVPCILVDAASESRVLPDWRLVPD